jgi:hypothetical protein
MFPLPCPSISSRQHLVESTHAPGHWLWREAISYYISGSKIGVYNSGVTCFSFVTHAMDRTTCVADGRHGGAGQPRGAAKSGVWMQLHEIPLVLHSVLLYSHDSRYQTDEDLYYSNY